jgi:MFS family permease
MREPEPPTVRARTRLRERVKDFPALLREDKGFAWFMVARSLAMGSRIGQPFFFLYAAYKLGISAEANPAEFGTTLAVLSLSYMGADTVTNLVWGYLSDRQGFRSTFVISLAINIVGVGALMMSHSVATFAISFFLIGTAQSGYMMSTSNIVLEYGHRHDVPMRMALSILLKGRWARWRRCWAQGWSSGWARGQFLCHDRHDDRCVTGSGMEGR